MSTGCLDADLDITAAGFRSDLARKLMGIGHLFQKTINISDIFFSSL